MHGGNFRVSVWTDESGAPGDRQTEGEETANSAARLLQDLGSGHADSHGQAWGFGVT